MFSLSRHDKDMIDNILKYEMALVYDIHVHKTYYLTYPYTCKIVVSFGEHHLSAPLTLNMLSFLK